MPCSASTRRRVATERARASGWRAVKLIAGLAQQAREHRVSGRDTDLPERMAPSLPKWLKLYGEEIHAVLRSRWISA